MTGQIRLALGSVAIGLVVLGLKATAWSITGSAALFSDAAETVVNVIASLVALAALQVAERPADANHPYGHEKAEFFSAVVEGALIIVASFLILQHAWTAYRNPTQLDTPLLGLAMNAVATVINAAWAAVLIRRGRVLRSAALSADGQHLLADVVTSIGIVIGVGLVLITGIIWLDPLLAAVTAVYILVSGMLVLGHSVGGLMDAAPPEATVTRIREMVSEHAAGAIEAHDLRTRHAGRRTFLEFHLVVPGDMKVSEAHEICDRIEHALAAEMDGLQVSIHVEPPHKAKRHGIPVV